MLAAAAPPIDRRDDYQPEYADGRNRLDDEAGTRRAVR
jgi:hypothetical protein